MHHVLHEHVWLQLEKTCIVLSSLLGFAKPLCRHINWFGFAWVLFPYFLNSRTNLGPAACAASSRPQTAGEDHPGPDSVKREAAPHAADLLQRQPEARCPNEGAAGGDDWPQPASDPGLVPEQAVQRQEEEPAHETAAAATA